MKGTHSLKTVTVEKLKQGFIKKLSSIFSRTEGNVLFEKTQSFEVSFGNENLLLNPLHAQCHIYGCLVSLGHFNDIVRKSDKLYEHIKGISGRKNVKLK